MVDNKLHFVARMKNVVNKSERSLNAFIKILTNIWSASEQKSKMLSSAIQLVILYGTPIWQGILNNQKYKGSKYQLSEWLVKTELTM